MVSSVIILLIALAIMYLMAYWFDKPWRFPLLSVDKRKELAQDRIDIIEGSRINWPEWVSLRGEWAINRENIELERLRRFVGSTQEL